MKDELGGKIMKEIVLIVLTPKMYSYLRDDRYVEKKAKGTKKCVIKQEIKFRDDKECLKNNKLILKSQQRFVREAHSVFTEKFNKIALGAYDDKRIQMSGRVIS